MIAVASGPASVHAERPTFDLDMGVGLMRGHTTYQIGGRADFDSGGYFEYRFPLSELKFPLDVYMASLGGTVYFGKKWNISLNAKMNITDDAGTMEDSDWGIYWLQGCSYCSRDSLDIYSESDAELDAYIIDIDFSFRFYNKAFEKSELSFFLSYGYMYEFFDFVVSDVDQWYPSDLAYFGTDGGHDIVSGEVLLYEIDYHMPFIGIKSVYKIKDTFSLEPALKGSYVYVTDYDDHLLRDKVSEGKLEGFGIIASLKGRYDFKEHYFSTLSIDYLYIEVDGDQNQSFGGVDFARIDQEIESEQFVSMLTIGRTF
jgi:hypothetical protein